MPRICAAQPVAIAHLQDFLDVYLAYLIQRKRLPFFVAWQPRRPMVKLFGQVAKIDKIAGGGNASGGDHVLQFTDVPRPRMLQQDGLRPAGQAGNILSVGVIVFLQEKLNQKGNVFQALG
jgi:hypothetical protein